MDADPLGRALDPGRPLSDEVEVVLDRLNDRWNGRWDHEAYYWTHEAPRKQAAEESTGDSEIRRLLASLAEVALPDELRALPLPDLLRYRRKTRAFSDEQKRLAQEDLDVAGPRSSVHLL